MAGEPGIKVEGMAEFEAALVRLRGTADEALKQIMKSSGELIRVDARKRTPARTGNARQAIKVIYDTKGFKITAKHSQAPYFRWLDYGGRVGRPSKAKASVGSVYRKVIREGRIIYPAFHENYDEVMNLMHELLDGAVDMAGLEPNG